MSDNGPIPELRFPEFSEDWGLKKLGNVTSKVGSGSTPRGGIAVYTNFGIPFIRSQNVYGNQLHLDSTFIPISVHKSMKGSTVRPKDILLNITGGSIGRSCVVPERFKEGNVNQHVAIIRLKNFVPEFVQFILASYRGQKLVYQGMAGGGREGLNFESIRMFKMHFPSLSEQQKIADFLSTVDQKIQALSRKKELLEQYKKGVMQKIFKQEIRFKPALSGAEGKEDGSEYPEWEERRFGDTFKFKQGFQFAVEEQSESPFENSVEFVRIINVTSSPEDKRYVADPGKEFHLIADDLFMVRYGDAGKIVTGFTGIIANNMFRLLPIVELSKKWHFFYLDFIYNKIHALAGSSTMPAIKFGTISGLVFMSPCLEEQQKIADYLSSIDTKIESVSNQINQNQTWKRGLLQKMFV